ncbi:MAG: ATP-binding cassette domain-containing protein [Kiritimatiellia bacterium]|nr:ATP-binding cassette domain-containing protein [Kiritimatiellia bacterium]
MKSAVRCEDVHVALGGQDILRGVSLDIPRGCLLPLVGSNGAGKTTLLKAILGLVPIHRGRVITPFDASRPGYVPQQKAIDPIYPVTLRRIVEMGLYPRLGWWRRPSSSAREEVNNALAELGLLEHQHKTFGALSGGMKQKALLARAFVSGADIVLLDEPTSELDEETEMEVLTHLRRLVAQEGRTVIFVHHGLHQAAALSDRICWVEHGRARMVDSAEALARPGFSAGGRP